MAMFNVIAKCEVIKGSSSKTEDVEATIDESSYYKAQGHPITDAGLQNWAKNFFPAADKVKLLSVRKK